MLQDLPVNGAGRRGIATELAREGARIVINSRDQDRADATAEEIAAATGGDVHGVAGDVAAPGGAAGVVDAAADALGGLDILVCNAGGPPPGNFDALDDDVWERAWNLTLMSVTRSVRAALPHMRDAGGGSILAVTSSSVKRPIPNLLMSNVYRPAVEALCKHLSIDLGPDGIRVNVLAPGRILTDRTNVLDRNKAEKQGKTLDEVRAASIATMPLGRLGEVEEFARAAAFLVSDAASYTTGTTTLVDGGMVRCL